MCGIFVCGKRESDVPGEVIQDELLPLVHNRGPDGYSDCTVRFLSWQINFWGSVLWMQGQMPELQPVKDEKGNVLLWNGDIFDGPWVPVDGRSDTRVVLERIFGSNCMPENILLSISSIKGPYSFVYWCESTQMLWFGRDHIGRHSLLCYFEDNHSFILTSVGKRNLPFIEVPVVGIFVIDFSKEFFNLTVYPWSDTSEMELHNLQNWPIPIRVSELIVKSPIQAKCPEPYSPSAEYSQIITEAVVTRCIFDALLSQTVVSDKVEQLLHCLRKAVMIRTKTHPGKCRNCLKDNMVLQSNVGECSHPKIGILFSGGLDSTVIAALAHESIPPHDSIDLFNVAFENQSKSLQNSPHFHTPDRTTGFQSSKELQSIFPQRRWNFIQINVSREELNNFRKTRIGDLIHPLVSILDDSLGCALWFACQLRGILGDSEYSSPARILLLGMGADEQFGGYMRHRTTLRHRGWSALAEEVDVELQRIATRNLGRDDRIVGDHGCQARFPFLDEDVINFVGTLPIWKRCYPSCELPPGFGDKLILRLAAWKLGLKNAAVIPKRAFQFGSRIANSKEKATDVSSRLML
ncbi:hypothetical protein R5R35_004895 [Gryllus longicercus]|uniref:Asparagine synthetase domain-containing protein n=1 Tax=Gryllus longicercus TaxID=2509291 RepID=A0AAN9VTE0_9ORTH